MKIIELENGEIRLEINMGEAVTSVTLSKNDVQRIVDIRRQRENEFLANQYANNYLATLDIPNNLRATAGIDTISSRYLQEIIDTFLIAQTPAAPDQEKWELAAKNTLSYRLAQNWLSGLKDKLIQGVITREAFAHALESEGHKDQWLVDYKSPAAFCERIQSHINGDNLNKLCLAMQKTVWY